MRWPGAGDQQNSGQTQLFTQLNSQTQMRIVYRVKSATEHPDRRIQFRHACRLFLQSFTDMAFTQHNILECGQSFQPHRPSRMQFVGTDPNLRAQTVFKTISKTS